MGVSLAHAKKRFTTIIDSLNIEPPLMSQFAVWLDIRLSEYKLQGFMSLDCQDFISSPDWLHGLKIKKPTSQPAPQIQQKTLTHLPVSSSSQRQRKTHTNEIHVNVPVAVIKSEPVDDEDDDCIINETATSELYTNIISDASSQLLSTKSPDMSESKSLSVTPVMLVKHRSISNRNGSISTAASRRSNMLSSSMPRPPRLIKGRTPRFHSTVRSNTSMYPSSSIQKLSRTAIAHRSPTHSSSHQIGINSTSEIPHVSLNSSLLPHGQGSNAIVSVRTNMLSPTATCTTISSIQQSSINDIDIADAMQDSEMPSSSSLSEQEAMLAGLEMISCDSEYSAIAPSDIDPGRTVKTEASFLSSSLEEQEYSVVDELPDFAEEDADAMEDGKLETTGTSPKGFHLKVIYNDLVHGVWIEDLKDSLRMIKDTFPIPVTGSISFKGFDSAENDYVDIVNISELSRYSCVQVCHTASGSEPMLPTRDCKIEIDGSDTVNALTFLSNADCASSSIDSGGNADLSNQQLAEFQNRFYEQDPRLLAIPGTSITDIFPQQIEASGKPWPRPYCLPPLRPRLMQKIVSGQAFYKKDKQCLTDHIYQHIRQYTLYPTQVQYDEVISALLHSYPSLQADMPLAVAKQFWKIKLKRKFGNSRKRNESHNEEVFRRRRTNLHALYM